jgi:3-oxoacid CoA-transferase subunit B
LVFQQNFTGNFCTLPPTGRACVQRVITDLAVIDVTPRGLVLREVAPGVTVDDIRSATGPELAVELGAALTIRPHLKDVL